MESYLPNSIVNLKSLIQFRVSSNNLSVLPEAIGKLSSLQNLDVQRNQLKSLPQSFGDLKCLNTLRINHNLLNDLPSGIGDLPSLSFVVWGNNCFDGIHPILRKLYKKGIDIWPEAISDDDTPHKDIALTKGKIKEFLLRLSRYGMCGGHEYVFASKALDEMNIPKNIQIKLLKKCKELDGYCDCEILKNAAKRLLGEETPW